MFSCNQNGVTIQASKALPRHDDYVCPACSDELIHCAGKKNQPYFRHINHTACVYTNVRPDPIEAEPNNSNIAQLREQLKIANLQAKEVKLQLELAQVQASLAQVPSNA